MDQPKPARGRPRKLPEEKRERITFFLLPKHIAKINAAGKEAFDALLERWRVKPPK